VAKSKILIPISVYRILGRFPLLILPTGLKVGSRFTRLSGSSPILPTPDESTELAAEAEFLTSRFPSRICRAQAAKDHHGRWKPVGLVVLNPLRAEEMH
jgi:hypothetical protein